MKSVANIMVSHESIFRSRKHSRTRSRLTVGKLIRRLVRGATCQYPGNSLQNFGYSCLLRRDVDCPAIRCWWSARRWSPSAAYTSAHATIISQRFSVRGVGNPLPTQATICFSSGRQPCLRESITII